MSETAPLVCLITPGHVASTPRLVKEADALVEAGYRVHVVCARTFPAADLLDADILGAARWTYTRVDAGRGAGAIARKILRRFSRRLVVRARFATVRVAARANGAEALHLGAIAARQPAALYIGHCLPALPAAALAARRRGAAYGFDAEDFHDAETEAVLHDPAEHLSAGLLQTRLLPGCAHLTAAAPLISRQYEEAYRVHPRTVLNVFPLAQAPGSPVDPGPVSAARPARVYWFSQTIGPGRGLESAVEVLSRMRTPVELHLRGFPSPGYPGRLQALASRAGLSRPVRFLPPGPPAEMARLAAEADLGLSTEARLPPNRNLCLTNKIFIYLLAGIPQLLSDTAAQSALAPELGEAALLADLGQPGAVAGRLDKFLGDPERVAGSRRRARELARDRFCWDLEKSIFLDSVRSVASAP
jgi:glycosyltransferase involved in cell wall biosynthesis